MNLFYFFINWFVGTQTKTTNQNTQTKTHKPKPQTKTTNQNHKPKPQTTNQNTIIRTNPSCFLAPSWQPIRTNQSPQKNIRKFVPSWQPIRTNHSPQKNHSWIRGITLLYKFQFYVPPYYFSFPYTYLRY